MKKIIITAFYALVSIGLFVSCGSTSNVKSAYYESNIGDFSEMKLDNGIPVVFKKNEGSQIAVVRVIFEGGVPFIPYEKSGLEGITLNLMLHGSENYSYQKIMRLEYEKSFSISKSNSKDYSTVSMSCIKRDFAEVLDILADGINNPLFLEKDFKQQMKLEEESLQSSLSDPMGKLGIELTETVFKNHPYHTMNSVNESSVKNISLLDVKNHHAGLLNSSRMKIVAVGNFSDEDEQEIFSKFNEYFGGVGLAGFNKPEIPKITLDSTKVLVECESAGEIGYAEGLFACPERDSEEYIPYVIASMFIDDSLFKIVREKNSAVYSVGTGIIGAKKLAGAISIFKASKTEGIKGWVTDAIADFPKSEKDVKEKLDSYKNKYITTIFENSQSVGGIAGNIVSSLIYRDSPSEYLNRTAQVQAVSAKDVMDAYDKYFAPLVEEPSKIKWIVLSGKETVGKFDF